MVIDEWLPLEKCTGGTPDCPHYHCPDGWHPGDAPNCSCTPDCAGGHEHWPRIVEVDASGQHGRCEDCEKVVRWDDDAGTFVPVKEVQS